MRYVLWVVALLEACDVTNNGRHLSRHLGFYQEVEIRLTARNGTFFSLTCKIAHKLAFCIILSTTFTLSLKEIGIHAFSHKNVSTCVGGINEQLLKTSPADVLSSRKKPRKRGGGNQPLSLLPLVRPRVNDLFLPMLRKVTANDQMAFSSSASYVFFMSCFLLSIISLTDF